MILNYIVWISVTLLYSPVFRQLYSARWANIDYTHAYFILPVSLWLIWRKRSDLKYIASNPQPATCSQNIFGLSLLIFGLFLFTFGWRQEYLLISTLSLIPLLIGMIIFLYGMKMARAVLFPAMYLLLLVPPPLGVLDSLTIPMRYGVSIAASDLLNLFHIPITRDGLLLSIGGNEIFMGPACSGFRSLITMISLGAAYAYISKGSKLQRWLLLLAVVPLALLGNLARVVGICLVTYYKGETAGAKFHDYSGFVIFIVLILGLVWLEEMLGKRLRISSSKPHNS